MTASDANLEPVLAAPAEPGRAQRLPTPAITGRARAIIREHVLLSAASALVPDPILCTTAVTAAHLDMLEALSRLYAVPYSVKTGRVLLTAALGGAITAGLLGQPLVRRAILALSPIILPIWFIGGSVIAGSLTHLLGHAVVRHYEKGGTLHTFDWHAFRRELAQKLGFPRPANVIPVAARSETV